MQLEAATVLEGLVGGASEHTVRAMEPAGLTGNLVGVRKYEQHEKV